MPDVHSAAIEVDGSNQPVLVSSNVEDHEALHPVSAGNVVLSSLKSLKALFRIMVYQRLSGL
jgi:hypothetical protein